jgi:hypothetical protein
MDTKTAPPPLRIVKEFVATVGYQGTPIRDFTRYTGPIWGVWLLECGHEVRRCFPRQERPDPVRRRCERCRIEAVAVLEHRLPEATRPSRINPALPLEAS